MAILKKQGLSAYNISRYELPQPGHIDKTWVLHWWREQKCCVSECFLTRGRKKPLVNGKHCISNLRESHLLLFLLSAQLLLSLHHCGVWCGNLHDRDRDADAKMEAFLTMVDSGSTLLISICRLYSSIQKLTCLLLATHVQAALSASASALLWTVSGWFPGQHLMNQREAYH